MKQDDLKAIFKERFDTLRAGRSNTEFAEFLGLSRQTVGFYLNGNRTPDALSLAKIAQRCGTSVDYLLGLCSQPSPDTELARFQERFGLDDETCHALGLSATVAKSLPASTGFTLTDFTKRLLNIHHIAAAWFCTAFCTYANSAAPDFTKRDYGTIEDGEDAVISARHYALLEKERTKAYFSTFVDNLWNELCDKHGLPHSEEYKWDAFLSTAISDTMSKAEQGATDDEA